jgi:large subunit ribosomal protein L34e
MVSGRFKSRSFRRVFKRIVSKTKLFYEDRKPQVAHCSECGDALKGIPRMKANEAKNTPKTKKRPERPYGGKLCSRCTRIKMKEKAN